MRRAHKHKGFALVEVVVALGIAATFFFSMMQFVNTSARVMRSERYARGAGLLAAEAEDGIRFLRDAGWTSNIVPVPSETTYYITQSGNTMTLSPSNPGLLNNLYTRTVVFHQVLRDAGGNVVQVGGSADANSRRITVVVSWSAYNAQQSITSDFYVNNTLRN